jgi:hypothetical protein
MLVMGVYPGAFLRRSAQSVEEVRQRVAAQFGGSIAQAVAAKK